MKSKLLAIAFAIMVEGCSHKKIEITSEYIVNGYWNKKGEDIGANSIAIKRLNVKKDSIIDPFSELTQAEILTKLEVDSTFIYNANVKVKQGESYEGKKIYFNRDNGFYWWTDKGERKTRTLGKLHLNTWYEISRLKHYYFVVYIDSANKIHPFVVNLANY